MKHVNGECNNVCFSWNDQEDCVTIFPPCYADWAELPFDELLEFMLEVDAIRKGEEV